MKSIAIALFALLVLMGCHSAGPKAETKQAIVDTARSTFLPVENVGVPDEQTDSCSYYVYAIVYTSDLKKKNKAYAGVLKDTATPISYFVDHSDDTSVIIHVGFDNNAGQNDNIETTLAWINVDLKRNEVRDITLDPENGILLKVDRHILHAMRQCHYKLP